MTLPVMTNLEARERVEGIVKAYIEVKSQLSGSDVKGISLDSVLLDGRNAIIIETPGNDIIAEVMSAKRMPQKFGEVIHQVRNQNLLSDGEVYDGLFVLYKGADDSNDDMISAMCFLSEIKDSLNAVAGRTQYEAGVIVLAGLEEIDKYGINCTIAGIESPEAINNLIKKYKLD